MISSSTIYVYHAGVWRPLSSGKVYHDGSFSPMTWTAKFRHNGEWYYVGPEPPDPDPPSPISPYTEDQYGKFPIAVQFTYYECQADTYEDPETGDTTYSNWRWVQIATERAEHQPQLESPEMYPESRWYSAGTDYLIYVNPATGHITGADQAVHNAVLTAPPPPAAGLDYYMDTLTLLTATE